MSEETTKHGFKFSYKNFEQTGPFIQTVRKVYSCEDYPSVKSAYKVKRLVDAIQGELKTYLELRQAAEKEENKEKIDELHEMEVDIKWDKLTADELACLPKVSPVDLVMLENIADTNAFAD